MFYIYKSYNLSEREKVLVKNHENLSDLLKEFFTIEFEKIINPSNGEFWGDRSLANSYYYLYSNETKVCNLSSLVDFEFENHKLCRVYDFLYREWETMCIYKHCLFPSEVMSSVSHICPHKEKGWHCENSALTFSLPFVGDGVSFSPIGYPPNYAKIIDSDGNELLNLKSLHNPPPKSIEDGPKCGYVAKVPKFLSITNISPFDESFISFEVDYSKIISGFMDNVFSFERTTDLIEMYQGHWTKRVYSNIGGTKGCMFNYLTFIIDGEEIIEATVINTYYSLNDEENLHLQSVLQDLREYKKYIYIGMISGYEAMYIRKEEINEGNTQRYLFRYGKMFKTLRIVFNIKNFCKDLGIPE